MVDMASAEYWQRIHRTKDPMEGSWYEAVPQHSLDLIRAAGVSLSAPILDVGGGTSRLVDHLLMGGYSDITVLDIAPAALERTKVRLGNAATAVKWIVSDMRDFHPEHRFALWHDRAVLHFLTSRPDQERYVKTLTNVLIPGGHVVLATFGPEGPDRCSGLPVQRYSLDELGALLGAGFRLRRSAVQVHSTPRGNPQQLLWGWWQQAM
jgi:SAM-dependent methyltransferase